MEKWEPLSFTLCNLCKNTTWYTKISFPKIQPHTTEVKNILIEYLLLKSWLDLVMSNLLGSINPELRTRKRATRWWPLSDAIWTGVKPALSFTINSCFVPAWTSTVQTSKFPFKAAQCKGVQPNSIGYKTHQKTRTRISKQPQSRDKIWLFLVYQRNDLTDAWLEGMARAPVKAMVN